MELSDQLSAMNQTNKGFQTMHSVIVHFTYYKDDLDPLHELETKLEKVIMEAKVGDYDGHEIALDMSDGFLYMYGPNAGDLFKAVKQTLEQTDFTRGAVATLRFGGPDSGASEIEIEVER
jgi:predicted transcriptional regulator